MATYRITLDVESDLTLEEVRDTFPDPVLTNKEAATETGWAELNVHHIKVEPLAMDAQRRAYGGEHIP